MYHQINLKTSEDNQRVIQNLTSNNLPTGTKENVIARIAIGYSLQTGKKFTQSDFDLYDSKGKEYKDHILFDPKYRDFYIALICQHYGIYKTNNEIPKYIKLHLDHGLESIDKLFEVNPDYTFFDFLEQHIEKGIAPLDTVEVSLDAVRNRNQGVEKTHYSGPLKIQIGNTLESDDPIYLNLNNTKLYNNCHMAVAGNSGTGKTQFALELLRQISIESNEQVNFIYLDFKGLKEEDLKFYEPFFRETNAQFINAPHTQFPVNPLTFMDNVNEVDKQLGIDKFVDIVSKYSNLGAKQKGKLREATAEAFLEKEAGEYPSIPEINEKLLEIVGDKLDTLTEIIGDLSRFNVFAEQTKNKSSFLNSNVYLSLSGDLSNTVRFTSLFLIINYIYNTFMNMENTPVENGTKSMRYVLLIDEAHVIFKEKKYQDLLEKILREIRSKGVSVVMLSQGIEEFDQESFDFSSMCEIAFLLDIKNKSNIKMMNRFLGFGEKEGQKVARAMEKIKKGEAISNIKEKKNQLFLLKQFKDYD